jgi:mRNA interferase RelE/StbE
MLANAPPDLTLLFDVDALKEYRRIDAAHRKAFGNKLKKLATRREQPSPKNALHGFPPGYYKIKLRNAGLRLVYHYGDENLLILVIAVGKRERNVVYEAAKARLEGRL